MKTPFSLFLSLSLSLILLSVVPFISIPLSRLFLSLSVALLSSLSCSPFSCHSPPTSSHFLSPSPPLLSVHPVLVFISLSATFLSLPLLSLHSLRHYLISSPRLPPFRFSRPPSFSLPFSSHSHQPFCLSLSLFLSPSHSSLSLSSSPKASKIAHGLF